MFSRHTDLGHIHNTMSCYGGHLCQFLWISSNGCGSYAPETNSVHDPGTVHNIRSTVNGLPQTNLPHVQLCTTIVYS